MSNQTIFVKYNDVTKRIILNLGITNIKNVKSLFISKFLSEIRSENNLEGNPNINNFRYLLRDQQFNVDFELENLDQLCKVFNNLQKF